MTTKQVTKKFGPYPAAHRQFTHSGHCALVHGHNWHVEVTLGVSSDKHLDENGFVFDFGKFGEFKDYLTHMLDHTLLISALDPHLGSFVSMQEHGLCDLRVLECGTSAEHMAAMFAKELEEFLVRYYPPDAGFLRARVMKVTVYEDEKNSATIDFTTPLSW